MILAPVVVPWDSIFLDNATDNVPRNQYTSIIMYIHVLYLANRISHEIKQSFIMYIFIAKTK